MIIKILGEFGKKLLLAKSLISLGSLISQKIYGVISESLSKEDEGEKF
jgi:hypothetical protein